MFNIKFQIFQSPLIYYSYNYTTKYNLEISNKKQSYKYSMNAIQKGIKKIKKYNDAEQQRKSKEYQEIQTDSKQEQNIKVQKDY